jgi:ribosome biogenesis GTPase
MHTSITLARLGWQPYFKRQVEYHETTQLRPARIVNQERSQYVAQTEDGRCVLPVTAALPAMTVGDWVLLDAESRFVRLLERSSLFVRKAPGSGIATQLVAANVDTLFIVCSLNQDFNLNRIERYLALAHEAHVQPVVVLSKADLCAEPAGAVAQVSALGSGVLALSVNGLDADSVHQLAPWCGEGQTVALMGSSGVGKSTLLNTLTGAVVQATQDIRSDDGKGRHTTTRRSLHLLADGGMLLDTPGMRELQLTACEDGLNATFAEIAALAARCRFIDCSHDAEPGCAVRAAIVEGEVDARRLDNFRKLLREQARNDATLGEQRERARKLGRQHRWAKFAQARKRKTEPD